MKKKKKQPRKFYKWTLCRTGHIVRHGAECPNAGMSQQRLNGALKGVELCSQHVDELVSTSSIQQG